LSQIAWGCAFSAWSSLAVTGRGLAAQPMSCRTTPSGPLFAQGEDVAYEVEDVAIAHGGLQCEHASQACLSDSPELAISERLKLAQDP
jgi:hypothetical protein